MSRSRSLLACCLLSALTAACAGGSSSTRTASPQDIDAYIAEASRRFDMPELWIREVIRQESGGRTGVKSSAGAMGLMQVMPGTYNELRRKHGLGSDPYDPRDNIIAGTAYLREMYDLYGAPGFLGAYNCGPGCYGDYLAGNRRLPEETRRYIAAVGPRLNRTPAADGDDIVLASAPAAPRQTVYQAPVQAAPAYQAPVHQAPVYQAPASQASRPPTQVVEHEPSPVISAPLPLPPPAPLPRTAAVPRGGAWTVQLGAFRSPDDGARVIDRARQQLPGVLDRTQRVVQAVDSKAGPLYRARLAGLSQQDAANACTALVGQGMACFVVPPGA